MEYLLVILALAVGFLAAWFLMSRKITGQQSEFEINERKLLAGHADIETQKSVATETLRLKTAELLHLQQELTLSTELSNSRGMELAAQKIANENLAEKLENQKTEIETLQKRLTAEFENIANKILKVRSDEFSVSNHKNLSEILNPLKEKIQSFEKKVDETYDKELRDKISYLND